MTPRRFTLDQIRTAVLAELETGTDALRMATHANAIEMRLSELPTDDDDPTEQIAEVEKALRR